MSTNKYKEQILREIDNNEIQYQNIIESLKKDRDVLTHILKKDGLMIKFLDNSLNSDRDLISIALN